MQTKATAVAREVWPNLAHSRRTCPAEKKRIGWKKQWSECVKGYICVAPAQIFLTLFTIYPVLRSVYLSFHETDAVLSFMKFTGLSQYTAMFTSPVFWEVTKNTLVYGIVQVVLSTVLGLFLAVAANSKKNRLKSLFKISLFYPYILPWTVGAMIWMYLLHPTRGLVNILLGTRIQWLNSYELTLYVLALISVWKTVGFNFLLFLSGLQSIPKEMYEAYDLESKSRWKALIHITVPMLGPTTFVTVLLSIVGSFQSVDLIYMLTQGRPGNSTNTLIYYIYQEGITNWNIGYGSALSTFLFLCLLIFTVFYLRMGERNVNYDQ